ncbi:unnamed protein product [Rotaria socialis]|uniref:Transient receptor potential cation channel subfamily A member 1 n=1 Tax=Rotaria socialis TaxID=392032 RepID=A0A820WSY2_9BILA|nr:unnamed protein product [Rotaria socialis]
MPFPQDVNLISWNGETSLHIAARLVNIKYPDHPIPDVYGNIPLHYACRFLQNDNMIGLFLSFPHLFNHETYDKKKPIDIAIEYNGPDVIKHFFDLGHIRYVENTKDIVTLDEVSTYSPEYEVLSFLKLQYEEVINGDHSLLSCACRQLHGHKMISHLINPNSIMYRDKKTGLSPLMVAVQHRQLQCIKELLNNKYFTQEAFELVSNISFRTVLHICTKVHNKEITKSLIDSRFMSTTLAVATDVVGDTPLHTCAQVGNVYMTQLLLDYITNHNSPVTTCSDSRNLLTMIKRDTDRRMPPEASTVRCINATSRYGSTSRQAHAILTKKNKSKLTPLHVAIQAGNFDIINEMLKYADSSVVNVFDDQQRTSLHMAAAKGHVGIINALLDHWADSHVCDMNEWTPLHHAARCSRNANDEERPQCIENLIKRGLININALTIRRETPLHIACEYGSSKLAKQLIEFDCDLLARNVDGHNCLEVAIEANNEEVVRYLIENDNCFDLMRNSQIRKNKRHWYSLLARHCEVDTPMRKLIRKMPNMALLVLDKCSMRVGIKGTNVSKNIFVYEFLEDQFTVNKWKGEDVTQSEVYTSNTVDLVMNHPLFLMEQYETHDLMSHPLSNYLVNLKFKTFGIFLYVLILLLYMIYLALFTTIVLRNNHPGAYYNLTNIDFEDSLCYNVSQALLTASPSLGGMKTTFDYILKYTMYIVIWSLIFKNMFNIIEILQISFFKTFRYWLETIALLLSFIFVHDRSYQTNLTFRCPLQWEYGAFALLLSWLTLLGYIQFIPVLGLYVTMLLVIIKKFMRFSIILLILISGFASTFYMLFQNFEPFQSAGLAVGEIPPLMKQASDNRTRLFFELVVVCEIFRYRIIWILRRGNVNDAIAYSYQNLDKKKWYERFEQWLTNRCSVSAHDDNDDDLAVNTDKLLEY